MAHSKPRLGYVFHPQSFSTFSLLEAAQDLCELVWIVDSADDDAASMLPLLTRTGLVVDVSKEEIDEAAEKVARVEPEGILTLADEHLEFTAHLAERLGLTSNAPEVARRLADKALQRAALALAGLTVPRQWVLEAPRDLESLSDVQAFPGVIKPRFGQGSRDTIPVKSLTEAQDYLLECWAVHPGRPFVLEEYIRDGPPGVAGTGFADYLSVEAFARNGDFVPLATNGRTPQARPFRETGFFIPSALTPTLAAQVIDLAGAATRALGVDFGCLHIEIKLTPEGPVIIEVNGRAGGGVPEMLADVAGVDLLAVAMKLALGLDPSVESMPKVNGVAFLLYLQAPEEVTRIEAVEGLDAVASLPGVTEVVQRLWPGEPVSWREGNHGYIASVRGKAQTIKSLHALFENIHSIFHVVGI